MDPKGNCSKNVTKRRPKFLRGRSQENVGGGRVRLKSSREKDRCKERFSPARKVSKSNVRVKAKARVRKTGARGTKGSPGRRGQERLRVENLKRERQIQKRKKKVPTVREPSLDPDGCKPKTRTWLNFLRGGGLRGASKLRGKEDGGKKKWPPRKTAGGREQAEELAISRHERLNTKSLRNKPKIKPAAPDLQINGKNYA